MNNKGYSNNGISEKPTQISSSFRFHADENLLPGDATLVDKCNEINKITHLINIFVTINRREYRVAVVEPRGARYVRLRVHDEQGVALTMDMPKDFNLNMRIG